MTTPVGLDIPGLAQLVLSKVVAQFAAASVALPDRRFVAGGAAGQIAHDEEQLVVTLGVIRGGAVGDGAAKVGRQFAATGLRSVRLDIELVRCEPSDPDNDAPPADVLHAAGLDRLRDAGIFAQAMVSVGTATSAVLPPGSQITLGDVVTIGPQGGLVGLQGSVTVTGLRFL